MDPIRVAFLGTKHPHIFQRFKYLATREDINLMGYYDDDKKISAAIESRAYCKRYENLDSLLAVGVDVVFIHGHDHENAQYMHLAIGIGARGIFVEKPGVSQPSEFFPIAELIASRGIIFECGWELHYAESIELARKVVCEAVLGAITTGRFHGGCPSGAGTEVWQSHPANIGGFLYSIGGHTIETVVDLFGLPDRVIASIRKLPPKEPHRGFSRMPNLFGPREVDPIVSVGSLAHEDIASAILEYPACNITLDLTAWEPNGYCENWAIEIYGTKGSLHLIPDPPSGVLLLMDDHSPWKKGKNTLFEGCDGASKLTRAFQTQIDAFLNRVRGEDSGGNRCDESITSDLLRLFRAMYDSEKQGCWMQVGK